MKHYNVIGIMSGSSLDGLDICLIRFTKTPKRWEFEILAARTYELPDGLVTRLRESPEISEEELERLNLDYGLWIGTKVNSFLEQKSSNIDLVAVHGHTVFHEPAEGISLQVGDGSLIAKTCGYKVIDQFRIDDVRKGGQGAPLVPVGEYHLFDGYEGFVNLGGICNITKIDKNGVQAWDIAPCNQVFNFFAQKLHQPFDKDGDLARSGSFDKMWHGQIVDLPYFQQKPPKSLSNQWGRKNLIDNCIADPKEVLHTYTQFLADLIVREISSHFEYGAKILFTGGGAYNKYLMELLKEKARSSFLVTVPDSEIVEYKEALIFGFLGLLKSQKEVNVFASVTGARMDSVAGTIHKPPVYHK